jgi:hypothetical protein
MSSLADPVNILYHLKQFCSRTGIFHDPCSCVSVMTRLQVGQQDKESVVISWQTPEIFFFLPCPDQLWDPPSLLSNECSRFFSPGMEQLMHGTIHPHAPSAED